MSDIIESMRHGAVSTITVNRAEKGNLLTVDHVRRLSAAIQAAGASEAKVILLRTDGPDFCRGRDPQGGQISATAMAIRRDVIGPILGVYDAIAEVPQPVICAVQGAAFGFGCALAAACDVTIAGDTARFRLPEMEKDLPPTLAISAMMNRVPRKALTWMVYSMQEINAETALQIGIVSSVVPTSQLGSVSDKLVADLTERSREALLAIKEYSNRAQGMAPRAAADYAGSLLATVLSSAAH